MTSLHHVISRKLLLDTTKRFAEQRQCDGMVLLLRPNRKLSYSEDRGPLDITMVWLKPDRESRFRFNPVS